MALAGVTCFVIARALPTNRPGRSAPPVTAATRPMAPPTVDPLPTGHVAEEKASPIVPDGRVTGERRKVHRSAHERRSAENRKARKDHPSRVKSKKRGHEVALNGTTSPAQPGDDGAARAAYAKGNRLLLTGDTGGAISAYEEATRLAPSSPAGYRGLGLAYEKRGNSAEAARAFRRYLKLAPGSEDRALIAERLQRLAPARKAGKQPR